MIKTNEDCRGYVFQNIALLLFEAIRATLRRFVRVTSGSSEVQFQFHFFSNSLKSGFLS